MQKNDSRPICIIRIFTVPIEGPPIHRGASASIKNGPAAPLPILLRPRVTRAQKIIPLHSLLFPFTRAENILTRGRPGSSSTARVERAHSYRARSASKGSYLAALTSFSAHPSTPSPPSLCAATRPWPVPAPSRHRDAAAERFRQRPSSAPHLF